MPATLVDAGKSPKRGHRLGQLLDVQRKCRRPLKIDRLGPGCKFQHLIEAMSYGMERVVVAQLFIGRVRGDAAAHQAPVCDQPNIAT
jgi:hypothetical protein